MDKTKECSWITLLPEIIFGAEGEGANGGNSEGGDGDEGDEGDGEGEGKGGAGSGSGDSEHDDADDPKVKGLKTALETERAAAKAANKELKRLRKLQDDKDLADKSEVDQATERAAKAEERATKLAEGLLKRTLNDAIRAAAKDFIDPDDAVNGIDRSQISYEQDDDDPTDIDIDEKSIAKAVKDLATKKPHFLSSGTQDGLPSGGQFGGSRKGKKADEDAALREKYPALR